MPQFFFEDQAIDFEDGDTVLESLLKAGKVVEHSCKAGACQSCLLRSNTPVSATAQKSLDISTIDAGGFLSCQAKSIEGQIIEKFDPSFFPVFKAIITQKQMLTLDICRLCLSVPEFGFYPGRFVQLIHSSGLKRPYSIATSALTDKSELELHIKLIPAGKMSEIIKESEAGDEFEVQGPFGKCAYLPEKSDQKILLIGSGTGLAPLYSVLCDALAQNHHADILLYHGSAHADGLYYADQLKDLTKKYQQLCFVQCADAGSEGEVLQGSPLDKALQDHPELDGYLVYLCGHPELVKQAQKRCFLAGASLKDIFADPFEYSS